MANDQPDWSGTTGAISQARPNPFTTVTAAVTSGQTVVPVKNAAVFVPGDFVQVYYAHTQALGSPTFILSIDPVLNKLTLNAATQHALTGDGTEAVFLMQQVFVLPVSGNPIFVNSVGIAAADWQAANQFNEYAELTGIGTATLIAGVAGQVIRLHYWALEFENAANIIIFLLDNTRASPGNRVVRANNRAATDFWTGDLRGTPLPAGAAFQVTWAAGTGNVSVCLTYSQS